MSVILEVNPPGSGMCLAACDADMAEQLRVRGPELASLCRHWRCNDGHARVLGQRCLFVP